MLRCAICSGLVFLATIVASKSVEGTQFKGPTHPLTVSGRALDSRGQPIAGAKVFLVSTNQFDALLGETTTDAQGRYAFRDVPLPLPVLADFDIRDNGYFQIFSRATGYALAWSKIQRLCVDLDKKAGRSAGDRTFFPGEKIELDLAFETPCPVSGRFVDERGKPLTDVKVTLLSCKTVDTKRNQAVEFREMNWILKYAARLIPEDAVATSDTDGRFKLRSVPKDKFCWLKVEHPDYADTGEKLVVTSANPPAIDGQLRPAKLPLEAILRSTRVVPVQITWADTGLAAAKVELNTGNQMPFPRSNQPAVSDREGRITLRLPTGTYQLSADPPRDSNYLPTSQEVRIHDQPTEQPVVLTMKPGCLLILKAIDAETGDGIAGGSFWAKNLAQQPSVPERVHSRPGHADSPLTDFHGELRAVVAPGTRQYGVDFEMLPEYRTSDPAEIVAGRRLELHAGETVTAEFRLVREPDDGVARMPVAVSGTVTFGGPRPEQKLVQPKQGAPILEESLLVDPETGGVANVVIYLEKAPPGVSIPAAPKARAKLDISGKQFVPRISAVRVGRPTIVTNADPDVTNVHTSPLRSAATNRVLGTKESLYWKYDKPERHPVGIQSDIHPWMKAYQVATDHPWIAITDKAGSFAIRGLPPGTYQFTVWHEVTGMLDRKLQVEVKDGGPTELKLHYPSAHFGR